MGGEVLDLIQARRSIGRLVEPAPSDGELTRILEAAVAAPDHGELRPWKFVILRGDAKDAFGQVLQDAYVARCQAIGAEPTDGQLKKERTKLGRAPLVVIVCAINQHSDEIPWVEQLLAAGAAAQNMLLAAGALGYASMWRTGPPAYDPRVMRAVALTDHDAIVGFVYLGTPAEGRELPPHEPDLEGLVEYR
ncbi:MAG TPA: nitroreductase [Acidimicrobiales bacterium]|nr:nitroreductase [Acidimicrobiales bacterium]